jgi:hypothetical protein
MIEASSDSRSSCESRRGGMRFYQITLRGTYDEENWDLAHRNMRNIE